MTGRRWSGRGLVAVGLCALLVGSACSGGGGDDAAPTDDEGTSGEGGWTFTDDSGTTHTLDEVPDTIVAQSVSAGGLWEYGIDVAGVFGPRRRADGSPDPSIGLADPDDFESVGEVDTQINLEAVAALRPDIIVTTEWGEGAYWGVDETNVDDLRAIAPLVTIRVEDRPMDEPLGRFAELAESLGAAPDDVAAARQRFDTASDRLAAALEAKPGLDVLAASGGYNELFVAWPPGFGDLAYYQELGMRIVEPEEHPAADGYWETLSWEQVDRYEADMILVDVRSGSLDDLLAQAPDVVSRLPATEADQLIAWPAAYAMGYGNVAEVIDGLAVEVEGSDADVV
jgi:iron complex transport system substrate-binding protein